MLQASLDGPGGAKHVPAQPGALLAAFGLGRDRRAAQCFLVWHQVSQEARAARLRFRVAGAHRTHSSVSAAPISVSVTSASGRSRPSSAVTRSMAEAWARGVSGLAVRGVARKAAAARLTPLSSAGGVGRAGQPYLCRQDGARAEQRYAERDVDGEVAASTDHELDTDQHHQERADGQVPR